MTVESEQTVAEINLHSKNLKIKDKSTRLVFTFTILFRCYFYEIDLSIKEKALHNAFPYWFLPIFFKLIVARQIHGTEHGISLIPGGYLTQSPDLYQ